MARAFNIAVCLAAVFAMATAQFDFFGGYPQFSGAVPRDPRANRGPVTFPVTQPGAETSGVVVGASGYGFVPPGGNKGGGKKRPTETGWSGKIPLPKLTDLSELELLLTRAKWRLEKAQQEAEVEADIQQRAAEDAALDSLRNTNALAEQSMHDAKQRILFIMRNWNIGEVNP